MNLKKYLKSMFPARKLNNSAIIISFPKSGRTWLRVMLDHLDIHVKYTHAGSDHHLRKHMDGLIVSEKYNIQRILFMIRDPRDTAVSGYFQATKRLNIYSDELSKFIRDPKHGLEKIIRFNILWLEASSEINNFNLIEYEHLHVDTKCEVNRIATFLTGKKYDDSIIANAVTYGSFDNMRKLETSNAGTKQYGNALSPGKLDDFNSYKTRKGKVGGWEDYFNPDDKSYAEDLFIKYNYFKIINKFSAKIRQ